MILLATVIAELVGILLAWLIHKITARYFPSLHAILRSIDEVSRHPELLKSPR
ncbi:hypothetical protein HC028_22450 [Planosporangium flavigriseum]|uniref:hypothetical protein n=1 Tax=Planosporangium flavigriseum TaxID=373681 RepID=UPI00143AF3B6|nr:hypothetical protein [Planosporangium flavigriseum]NJC67239.1 hypothetical protein [Planosporangium flavigriseum]